MNISSIFRKFALSKSTEFFLLNLLLEMLFVGDELEITEFVVRKLVFFSSLLKSEFISDIFL